MGRSDLNMCQGKSVNNNASGGSKWNGTVRPASVVDLDALLPLFEGYRAFYGASADAAGARRFLLERFRFNQSIVFLAEHPQHGAVGFAQLYPFFSSVGLAQVFVLNDLFVVEAHRGAGVGERLLNAVREHAQACGAAKLRLSTAVTNQRAQGVYERAGWKREESFYTYELTLAGKTV